MKQLTTIAHEIFYDYTQDGVGGFVTDIIKGLDEFTILTLNVVSPPDNDALSINVRYKRIGTFSPGKLKLVIKDGSDPTPPEFTTIIEPNEEGYWATKLVWTNGILQADAIWVPKLTDEDKILFFDTFNSPDGTKLNAHTPDVGQGYLVSSFLNDGVIMNGTFTDDPNINFDKECYFIPNVILPATNFYVEYDQFVVDSSNIIEAWLYMFTSMGFTTTTYTNLNSPIEFNVDRGFSWHQIDYNKYSNETVNDIPYYYNEDDSTGINEFVSGLVGAFKYNQINKMRIEYVKDVGSLYYCNGILFGMNRFQRGINPSEFFGFHQYYYMDNQTGFGYIDNLKIGRIGDDITTLQQYEYEISLRSVGASRSFGMISPASYVSHRAYLKPDVGGDTVQFTGTVTLDWILTGPKILVTLSPGYSLSFDISMLSPNNTLSIDFTNMPARSSRKSIYSLRNGQTRRFSGPDGAIDDPAYLDNLNIIYTVNGVNPKIVTFEKPTSNFNYFYVIFDWDGTEVTVADALMTVDPI